MRRLNSIIDHWEEQHHARLTSTELVARLAEQGHTMSLAYMSQLRTGRRRQPSPQLLFALGEFFGVPAEYFVDQGADSPPTPTEIVSRLHDSGLRQLLTTVIGLSPQSLDHLNEFADRFRRAERLADDDRSAEWVLRPAP